MKRPRRKVRVVLVDAPKGHDFKPVWETLEAIGIERRQAATKDVKP